MLLYYIIKIFVGVTIQLIGVWITKEEFKKQIRKKVKLIIEQITKFITERIEELTASLTAGFLCINMDLTNIISQINIDWTYETVRIILSLGTSILSGYIVHVLKNKYWNKNGNGTNIPGSN